MNPSVYYLEECFYVLPSTLPAPPIGGGASTDLRANRLTSWISSKAPQSINGKSGTCWDIQGLLCTLPPPPSSVGRGLIVSYSGNWLTPLIETLIHSWLILTFLIQRNDYLSHNWNIYEQIKFVQQTWSLKNTCYFLPGLISWKERLIRSELCFLVLEIFGWLLEEEGERGLNVVHVSLGER